VSRACHRKLQKDQRFGISIGRFLLVSFAVAMALSASLCDAATYKITKIVDQSVAVPGGGWVATFNGFGPPALDGEQVVFSATAAGFQGIVESKDKSLEVLASNFTSIPGSHPNKTFARLWEPDVDGDDYVFFGDASLPINPSEMGIYLLRRRTVSNGAVVSLVSAIAEPGTTIPGSSPATFDYIDYAATPTIDHGSATYRAGGGGAAHPEAGAGVYQYHTVGTTGYIANLGTGVPNTSEKFNGFSRISSYGADAAFVGHSPSGVGVYRAMPWTGVQRIADTTTAIPTPPPGETGQFTSFMQTAISDTAIAFSAIGPKTSGIYAAELNSTNVVKVVDTSTLAPGAGSAFHNFGPIALDDTLSMAFIGYTGAIHGIYTSSLIDGSLSRVVSSGQSLGGKVVLNIDFRQQGFDGANAAFGVQYFDGSRAVYLAQQTIGLLNGPEYVPLELSSRQRRRFDFSFGSTGGGITQPLFLAPTRPLPAIYRDFVVEGPAFASIVLPPIPAGETPISLLLYNEALGGYVDDPIFLDPGETLDLLAHDPDGYHRFRLAGLPMVWPEPDQEPDPLGFGAVGVTFLEATDSMASLIITVQTVPGDTNADGIVDDDDYANLVAQFGDAPGLESADFNDDNRVDLEDFLIMRENFGIDPTPAPIAAPGAVTPEPGTLMLLASCGLALLRRQRRP
jgi:hypothetical protein